MLADFMRDSQAKVVTFCSSVSDVVNASGNVLLQNVKSNSDCCQDVKSSHLTLSTSVKDFVAQLEEASIDHQKEVEEWSKAAEVNLHNVHLLVKSLNDEITFERSTGIFEIALAS